MKAGLAWQADPLLHHGTAPDIQATRGRVLPRGFFVAHTHPQGSTPMLVEMRPLSSITPYENNPRINDDAVDAVAASIREFGFRQPIVVDEQYVIIVGHTRDKAALKLGLQEVPVHGAVGLNPAQAKAYRLADNKTVR